MATVIAVYNSDGCVGRCDANCHDAVSTNCTCICGGANHGKGLRTAIDNNMKRWGIADEVVQDDGTVLRFPKNTAALL